MYQLATCVQTHLLISLILQLNVWKVDMTLFLIIDQAVKDMFNYSCKIVSELWVCNKWIGYKDNSTADALQYNGDIAI